MAPAPGGAARWRSATSLDSLCAVPRPSAVWLLGVAVLVVTLAGSATAVAGAPSRAAPLGLAQRDGSSAPGGLAALQAQEASLQSTISADSAQIHVLAGRYFTELTQLQARRAEVKATSEKVAAERRVVSAEEGQLRSSAVVAYVDAGTVSSTAPQLVSADANQLAMEQAYEAAAQGNLVDATTALRVSVRALGYELGAEHRAVREADAALGGHRAGAEPDPANGRRRAAAACERASRGGAPDSRGQGGPDRRRAARGGVAPAASRGGGCGSAGGRSSAGGRGTGGRITGGGCRAGGGVGSCGVRGFEQQQRRTPVDRQQRPDGNFRRGRRGRSERRGRARRLARDRLPRAAPVRVG